MVSKILTVIVPSYNMEKYLPRCLGSLVVAPELMEKLEVLVVNDGSKDRTSEIAHEFAEKYPQTFRVIDKSNGNYGSCVNAGMLMTSGVFVRVLDADDYQDSSIWHEFVTQLSKFAVSNVDLFITKFRKVDGEENVIDVEGCIPVDVGNPFLLNAMPKNVGRLDLHSITYRTDRVRSLGYQQTEGVSYTDTEWITTPLAAVREAVYFDNIVTNYLVGRDGQTMDPQTYARNFHVVCDLVVDMVRQYELNKSKIVASSREFYLSQLLISVRMVYFALIFQNEYYEYSGNLKDFDLKIKSASSEIYEILDMEVLPSRHFPLRVIHYYRKWQSRYHPILIAHRLYGHLARGLRCLINK